MHPAPQTEQDAAANADTGLALAQYQAATDADEVDLALIEALLMCVCGEGAYKHAAGPAAGQDPAGQAGQAPGALLVFLPGGCCIMCACSMLTLQECRPLALQHPAAVACCSFS